MAPPSELARTGESRWACAYDGDGVPGRHTGLEQLELVLQHVVGRVALQQGDLDRLFVSIVQDAGAFTQHFYRARARAGMTERIGLEDHAGGAAQITGRNFLDEYRDVDVCRTGNSAGGVMTEEPLVRFEQCVVMRPRRGGGRRVRRPVFAGRRRALS